MDRWQSGQSYSRTFGLLIGLLAVYELYIYGSLFAESRASSHEAGRSCVTKHGVRIDCLTQQPIQQQTTAVSVPAASRYIFLFGDSYSSIEYNPADGPQPSVDNPFGNSEFDRETAYKDEKWIDTMYMQFPPRTTIVYNYAVGGNLVNSSRMPEKFIMTQNPSKDMIDQVDSFENIDRKVEWTGKNSLFISWFGINDIDAISVLTDISIEEAKAILRADMSDYWDQVARLYELGARKFIHIYVPPFDRAPLWTEAGREHIRDMLKMWNSLLEIGNETFIQQTEQPVVSAIFDPAPVFHTVLDNLAVHGAPNNFCSSMKEEDHCLWRDPLHPGRAIHEALGNAIYFFATELVGFQ